MRTLTHLGGQAGTKIFGKVATLPHTQKTIERWLVQGKKVGLWSPTRLPLNLPMGNTLRSASTVSIFKTKLKTHLFRHAFLS